MTKKAEQNEATVSHFRKHFLASAENRKTLHEIFDVIELKNKIF